MIDQQLNKSHKKRRFHIPPGICTGRQAVVLNKGMQVPSGNSPCQTCRNFGMCVAHPPSHFHSVNHGTPSHWSLISLQHKSPCLKNYSSYLVIIEQIHNTKKINMKGFILALLMLCFFISSSHCLYCFDYAAGSTQKATNSTSFNACYKITKGYSTSYSGTDMNCTSFALYCDGLGVTMNKCCTEDLCNGVGVIGGVAAVVMAIVASFLFL